MTKTIQTVTVTDEMMIAREIAEVNAGITIDEAAERFLVAAQAIVDAHYASDKYYGATLTLDKGRKGQRYFRVWRNTLNLETMTVSAMRSIHCFIDVKTGNVLKAASWKAPETKNPRGNVFDANPASGCTWCGTAYIK